MKRGPEDAHRWMRQAENDLAACRALLHQRFYAQACFYAQQASEKALKAVHYLKGGHPRQMHKVSGTSGLLQMVIECVPSFRRFEQDVPVLDQLYLAARYPDALPEGAPFEVYTESQADEAFRKAQAIVSEARIVFSDND